MVFSQASLLSAQFEIWSQYLNFSNTTLLLIFIFRFYSCNVFIMIISLQKKLKKMTPPNQITNHPRQCLKKKVEQEPTRKHTLSAMMVRFQMNRFFNKEM